jgi:flavin-binding protein dodecin
LPAPHHAEGKLDRDALAAWCIGDRSHGPCDNRPASARDVPTQRATMVTVVASQEAFMSVAKVTEISSTSTTSFEDAINVGLARASKTIRNIRSAWVKEQQVRLENGKIVEYQVNMMLTFVLED